jgi:hypothetical protein
MSSGLLPGMDDLLGQANDGASDVAEVRASLVSAPTRKTKGKVISDSKKQASRRSASKDLSGLDEVYARKVQPHVAKMSWLLRITDYRDKPSPVLVVKYRRPIDKTGEKTELVERGSIYGDSLRRCLPSIRNILSRVRDENDVHLDLHQFLGGKQITFRGNLPLNEQAGAKLGLLFKLQSRVKDMDRVELMAIRINKFTGEEASYWLSRISHFGTATNRWAEAGMRIILGGQSGDPAIAEMLRDIERE